MIMLEEDYCSFEVAKLLKEKGFDEHCIRHWDCDDHSLYGYNDIPISNSELQANEYNGFSAPSQSMAMKWLREVHKLTFIISPQWAEGDMRNPCRWYWEIRGLDDINIDVYNNPLCNTYEEAVEAALKYSLENLI